MLSEVKLKNVIESLIIKELGEEIGDEVGEHYSPITVQLYTSGGTTVLLYKGDARNSERSSDASIKTPTQFRYLLNQLGKNISGYMVSDRGVLEILNSLTPEEINSLQVNNMVLTTNISPDLVNKFINSRNNQDWDRYPKTGTSDDIGGVELQENKFMKEHKLVKILKQLVAEAIGTDDAATLNMLKGMWLNPDPSRSRDYGSIKRYRDMLMAKIKKIDPNFAFDDQIFGDIVDSEMLLLNPDPSRAKDYGSVEGYKNMLRSKIKRLRSSWNPAGGGQKSVELSETITTSELKSIIREVVGQELRRAKKSAKKR